MYVCEKYMMYELSSMACVEKYMMSGVEYFEECMITFIASFKVKRREHSKRNVLNCIDLCWENMQVMDRSEHFNITCADSSGILRKHVLKRMEAVKVILL